MLNNNKVWRAYQIVSPSLKPSAHWIRHTRLMDLAGEGWELGKLQRRAGHTTVTSTTHYINYVSQAKSYIHLKTLSAYFCTKRDKLHHSKRRTPSNTCNLIPLQIPLLQNQYIPFHNNKLF